MSVQQKSKSDLSDRFFSIGSGSKREDLDTDSENYESMEEMQYNKEVYKFYYQRQHDGDSSFESVEEIVFNRDVYKQHYQKLLANYDMEQLGKDLLNPFD